MNDFMKVALNEAKKAEKEGEVPIGAVIVMDGKILTKAHNCREKKQNALAHAEVLAINKACKKTKSWRLDNAVMYVTLEPCPMCIGAALNARIKTLIYAASDKTSGDNLAEKIVCSSRLNHNTKIVKDPAYEEESSRLLTNFFKSKRK